MARYVNGEFHIAIVARRDIQPGMEISYDYNFQSYGPLQKCYCGSDLCRGSFLTEAFLCLRCRLSWCEKDRVERKDRQGCQGYLLF